MNSKKSINTMSLAELQKRKEEMMKQQKEIANMIRLRQKEAEIAKACRFMEWGKTIKFSDGATALEAFERMEAAQRNGNNIQGTNTEENSSEDAFNQEDYSEENDATDEV